jgi:hypothetical protein
VLGIFDSLRYRHHKGRLFVSRDISQAKTPFVEPLLAGVVIAMKTQKLVAGKIVPQKRSRRRFDYCFPL